MLPEALVEYGECRCSSEQVIIVVVCCVESFRIASGRVLGRERMGGRACLLFPLQQQSSQSRDYVIGVRHTPADAINTIISDTNAELQLHLHHSRHGYREGRHRNRGF